MLHIAALGPWEHPPAWAARGGWQFVLVFFLFFLSLSFIFEMLNPPRSPRVSPFLRSSIAPAWGGEGAEGSPVDAQEQGLEINK